MPSIILGQGGVLGGCDPFKKFVAVEEIAGGVLCCSRTCYGTTLRGDRLLRSHDLRRSKGGGLSKDAFHETWNKMNPTEKHSLLSCFFSNLCRLKIGCWLPFTLPKAAFLSLFIFFVFVSWSYPPDRKTRSITWKKEKWIPREHERIMKESRFVSQVIKLIK